MKTAVVIPTYNEAENLRPLALEILALLPEAEIVVVDDASPDGTGGIADELARQTGRVHAIHRRGKLGLGSANTAGIKFALERSAENIITMDADYSHHPRYLPTLLLGMDRVDVMIGSRYVPGGGLEHWPIHRRLLSKTANWVSRLLLALPAKDSTAGLRCYSRRVFERVDPAAVKSEGYSYQEEMLFLIFKAGLRIGETPIIFADRVKGRSKISRKEVVKAVLTLIRLRWRGGR